VDNPLLVVYFPYFFILWHECPVKIRGGEFLFYNRKSNESLSQDPSVPLEKGGFFFLKKKPLRQFDFQASQSLPFVDLAETKTVSFIWEKTPEPRGQDPPPSTPRDGVALAPKPVSHFEKSS
jgi:hypothetical protein